MRADSGPRLARQEVYTGVIIGTTLRRKTIVILRDRVVALLGNDEERIGHLGVLDRVEVDAVSILYERILRIDIYDQSIRI